MTGDKKPKVRGNGQGTVRQVGKKWRWEITLGFRSSGSRISKSRYAETKGKAEAAKNAALTDYSRGLIGEPDKVTVADFAARWLRRQHDVTPRTAKKYGQELDYALEHIGSMRLQDVRPHHLKDVVGQVAAREMRNDTRMSRSTLGRTLTRLRSMFKEAVADQIIYVNPMDGVKLPKISVNETASIKALNPDQAARLHIIGSALYDAGLCRLWPALFLSLGMGLRRGEVMGLKWADVDLARGTLRIRQTRVMDVQGIVTGNPKTTNSRRELHLPASVTTLLKRHRAAQDTERAAAGPAWQDGGVLFATALGEWTHPDNLNRALSAVLGWTEPTRAAQDGRGSVWTRVPRELRPALKVAALAGERLPDISPHDLRHTYATLALRHGVPVEVVSKNLGHGSPAITFTVYRHVLDDELRATVVDLFPTLPTVPSTATAVLN
ncbi:site-specific integrase [Deinococcus rubellus]|uniref:Site-specific integrase n=1 Tax=Deinococcus rubellus TaxID=1889240 RepID=A0ABY5YIU2_9DEIO|nr:site-specific integrase [Deinococcus rubellus]UWX65039.1 site-specific integrase [Deinococcus rubellus]